MLPHLAYPVQAPSITSIANIIACNAVPIVDSIALRGTETKAVCRIRHGAMSMMLVRILAAWMVSSKT